MKAPSRRLLLFVERASCAIGLAGLLSWGAFHVRVTIQAKHDLDRFAALRVVAQKLGAPDQSLWSTQRVSAWRRAQTQASPTPLAVLRIPKIGLEVPVLPGTDEATLDRAVGHIEDTAQPGTDGNLGIAGHRDGFFRAVKDIAPGDVIEIDTIQGTDIYRVERTWVVNPEDVSVLDPTSTRTLTLVTCYPFYFIGSAPHRFIVRAVRVDDGPGPASASTERGPCSSCAGRHTPAFSSSSRIADDRQKRLEMERVS